MRPQNIYDTNLKWCQLLLFILYQINKILVLDKINTAEQNNYYAKVNN